jgi:hypothetical protein
MGGEHMDADVFEIIMDGNDVVVTEENGPSRLNESYGAELVESDDESLNEEELTWRADPKESLSDWTIQVVSKGSATPTSYHCHKSVLAVGPRRSIYFASTFASSGKVSQKKHQQTAGDPSLDHSDMTVVGSQLSDYTDHQSSTTRFEVERLAAKAFPALLDYMYSTKGKLDIDTENATALFALSAQLGIKSLRRKVKDFWMKDMTMENLTTYYGHARVFKDSKILGFAEDYCAKHIFEVKETLVVEILTAVDPHFFLRVVSSSIMKGDEQAAMRLSLLIAVYGNIHKNELSPSMFLRLTAAGHLPTVEVKAATVLLELEDDICDSADRMTSLKERAIKVISKNWEDACFTTAPANPEPDQDPFIVDDKICILPRVRVDAMEVFAKQTLAQAKRDRASSAQELKELRAFKAERIAEVELVERLTKELETAKAEIDKLKEANEELRKASKMETDSLRQAKMKLQSELSDLKKVQALQDDMLKLKQVASGGAKSLLRAKDNHV